MGMLRRIAEHALRDVTRVRRMPPDLGGLPFVASSAGGLRQLLRPVAQADPDLFATARALVRPGDTVWDIGANTGLFTVAAAGLAGAGGAVVAFEPDVVLVALLRRTAGLQAPGTASITIAPCGIAGRTGLHSFSIARRSRASNSLSQYGNSQAGGVRETQTIACFALDDMMGYAPVPAVVKIDVEGAEIELLEGGSRFLRSVRPAIACEVAPRNAEAASAMLLDAGYRLFDAARPLTAANEIGTAAWNTIALPAEKADAWLG